MKRFFSKKCKILQLNLLYMTFFFNKVTFKPKSPHKISLYFI